MYSTRKKEKKSPLQAPPLAKKIWTMIYWSERKKKENDNDLRTKQQP
jgi:hypothetical protein